MPSLSTNGLGFSPAGAESLDGYGRALNTMYGDGLPAQRSAYVRPLAWAYYAKGVSSKLWKQAKGLEPPDSIIRIGSDPRYRCIFPLYTMFIGLEGSGRGFRFRGRSS